MGNHMTAVEIESVVNMVGMADNIWTFQPVKLLC